MKNFFDKHKWKLLAAFVLFFIVVPALINLAFKLHAPCDFLVAAWSAGDVLSFYGAMLSSLTTIVGVYLSIDYAQRNYREDEANRVRPYLALTHYRSKFRLNPLSSIFEHSKNESDQNSGEFYEEYKLDKVFIIIGKDGICFKNELTDAQKQLLQTGGREVIRDGNGKYSFSFRNFVSLPFEIENVGSGVALNTKIAFYRADAEPRAVNIFTMKTGQSAYCYIFGDDPNPALYGKYVLEFVYGDILGNRYSQKYNVEFGIDAENGKFFNSIDLVGEQKRKP